MPARRSVNRGSEPKDSVASLETLLKRGDARAFRTLYDTHHHKLYNFSLTFTHSSDDAKEVVQNVFYRLWQYRKSIDPKRPIEPYLFRIAKHENMKFLKEIAKRDDLCRVMYERMQLSTASPEQDIIFEEYQIIAQQAIQALPPKRRLVYEMSCQQGKDANEIAHVMNISPKTVRVQLMQAIRFIRGYIKQHADLSLSALITFLYQLL